MDLKKKGISDRIIKIVIISFSAVIHLARIFLFGLIIAVVYFISVYSYLNIGNAKRLPPFSAQLFESPLPAETELLDTDQYLGILHHGNSEREKYYAALLVKSALSQDELQTYYEKIAADFSVPRKKPFPIPLIYDEPALEVHICSPLSCQQESYYPPEGQTYPFCDDTLTQMTSFENIYFVCVEY